jgi:hypothetical protein
LEQEVIHDDSLGKPTAQAIRKSAERSADRRVRAILLPHAKDAKDAKRK